MTSEAASQRAQEPVGFTSNLPLMAISRCSAVLSLLLCVRCRQQPLIIRGPGAGAEVTAGGVFSDLLRLAAYLGAPS